MSSKIEVLSEAARYIADRGGHVFIRHSPRHGCCGGTAYVPVIDVGQPRNLSDYRVLTHDRITIYLHKESASSESLTIGLDGIWKWQKLWVEGSRITM